MSRGDGVYAKVSEPLRGIEFGCGVVEGGGIFAQQQDNIARIPDGGNFPGIPPSVAGILPVIGWIGDLNRWRIADEIIHAVAVSERIILKTVRALQPVVSGTDKDVVVAVGDIIGLWQTRSSQFAIAF